MDVSISQLRANLMTYLELVDRGETINVTDEGRIRAVLKRAPNEDDARLERGIREGWLTPGATAFDRDTIRRPMTARSREGYSVEEFFDKERDR